MYDLFDLPIPSYDNTAQGGSGEPIAHSMTMIFGVFQLTL
jgi:hypothetical protein